MNKPCQLNTWSIGHFDSPQTRYSCQWEVCKKLFQTSHLPSQLTIANCQVFDFDVAKVWHQIVSHCHLTMRTMLNNWPGRIPNIVDQFQHCRIFPITRCATFWPPIMSLTVGNVPQCREYPTLKRWCPTKPYNYLWSTHPPANASWRRAHSLTKPLPDIISGFLKRFAFLNVKNVQNSIEMP